MPDYPPEPWRLAGEAHLSAWRLPLSTAPNTPAGVEPLVVAGHVLLVTAWVEYRPPGQLHYNELLAAIAVRNGYRIAATITDIWVDSEPSLAGGRELWGIPKDMATFDLKHGKSFTASASTSETWVATAAFTPRSGLPFAVPSRGSIIQGFGDTLKSTPVRVRTQPQPASASWHVNPDGPLGCLADRSPLTNGRLRDFDLTFGGTR